MLNNIEPIHSDVPVVSVRNMLTPHILKHANLDEYYFTKMGDGKPDWRHVRRVHLFLYASELVYRWARWVTR